MHSPKHVIYKKSSQFSREDGNQITNKGLAKLVNLTSLDLSYNSKITNDIIFNNEWWLLGFNNLVYDMKNKIFETNEFLKKHRYAIMKILMNEYKKYIKNNYNINKIH